MTGVDSTEVSDADLKARLLAPRAQTESGMPEEDVEIPDIGTVHVRGLSRGEVFMLRKLTGDDEDAFEVRMLSRSMVHPAMTEDEVRAMRRVSPAGELEDLTERVRLLSGLGKSAEKAAMVSFRDEPGAGVRALPGSEAVDDGGPAAGADER